MAIHILDYAVILWLIAPLIIISAKYFEDKTLSMKWFGAVILFEIGIQKSILLEDGEWFLANILVHIFFIWPLIIAFYIEKAQLTNLKELFIFTKPMRNTALFALFIPIIVYAITAPSIAGDVKVVHLETLMSIQLQDEPLLYMMRNTNADDTLLDLPQQIPKLLKGSTRILVYPHQAIVIVTGDTWTEEFTYMRSYGQWTLAGNYASSFIE